MELRPIQAVLFAGRSVSRRATTTPSPLSYPLVPSLFRSFSLTRPYLSEAEATAPQQQEEQQQPSLQQPQQQLSGNTSFYPTFGLASLLSSDNPTSTTPPTTSSTNTPAQSSNESRPAPWAKPSSENLARSQAKRKAGNNQKVGILDTLEDLNLLGPNSEDLLGSVGSLRAEQAADVKYRLRPSVGRTIHMSTKVDLARGLALLNTRVRSNKVSQDFNKQRFHERPGLKRKRLRSERWRARFKDGFKASCSRVQELARQGW
ncbi:hypothetical protein diail_3542 [Diaporthe ilicicola]|nr:hypothetical protein diail_3542 [Diaporthe ilicicola]